jgi:hypothetical protein
VESNVLAHEGPKIARRSIAAHKKHIRRVHRAVIGTRRESEVNSCVGTTMIEARWLGQSGVRELPPLRRLATAVHSE